MSYFKAFLIIVHTPQIILRSVSEDEAKLIKQRMEVQGATVTIEPDNLGEVPETENTSVAGYDNSRKKIGCSKKIAIAFGIYVFVSALIGIISSQTLKSNTPKSVSSVADKQQSEVSVNKKSAQMPPQNTPKPSPPKNTPKPLPKIVKPYEAPILEGAIYLYPETEKELIKAGFPKTLKKLGLKNIKRCNELIPLAAKKAATNKNCDAVEIVDIADCSTKDNLVIYVWAKNRTKFYFTEKELMEKGPVMSEQEKLAPLLPKHELMAEEVIKSQLNYPSTYDRHELGVFRSRTCPTCNEIMIEFSARNAFNLELTYIATVQFDKNNKVVGFHMQEKR